jgi:hypothetical protein
MATKYLKNRKFNQALRNIAFWGYWTGAGKYAPGTDRENATWLEALVGQCKLWIQCLLNTDFCRKMSLVGHGSFPCTVGGSLWESSSKKIPAAQREHGFLGPMSISSTTMIN